VAERSSPLSGAASQGFPALWSHGLQRIGGKKQHGKGHEGHAEHGSNPVHRVSVVFASEFPEKEDVFMVPIEMVSTLQLKSVVHATRVHPGTGTQSKSPEVSRCCIRVFQAADSGRSLCERDQQNVHADGLQIQ